MRAISAKGMVEKVGRQFGGQDRCDDLDAIDFLTVGLSCESLSRRDDLKRTNDKDRRLVTFSVVIHFFTADYEELRLY